MVAIRVNMSIGVVAPTGRAVTATGISINGGGVAKLGHLGSDAAAWRYPCRIACRNYPDGGLIAYVPNVGRGMKVGLEYIYGFHGQTGTMKTP